MKFSIYTYNKFGSKIYVTQFDPFEEHQNLYSTFNEKLNHADNDQITLTFSLTRKVPNNQGEMIVNPYLKHLVFGSKVGLETERNTYELIITQIAPKSSTQNTVYDFTCQDEISYKWPKLKLGYSYDTMERGGVRTIFQIAQDILIDCKLDKQWQVKDHNNHLYPNANLLEEPITLQVEGSNPYNVLIEALNTLNASMLVNYRTREIRFYQKDKVLFSGYRYRPETNLRSFSANFNIDELATILHVVGGTDEYNMNVMLVPPMPTAVQNYLEKTNPPYALPADGYLAFTKFTYDDNDPLKDYYTMTENETSKKQEQQEIKRFCTIADKVPSLGQFLYNFDFFRQNGLMTPDQYKEIKDIFDIDMSTLNRQLKPLLMTYYMQQWDMQKTLFNVESELEKISAAYSAQIDGNGDLISDVTNYKQKIQDLFGTDFIRQYTMLYGKVIDPDQVPELKGILTNVENYITIRDDARQQYDILQNQHKEKYGANFPFYGTISSDYDQAQLQGEILYYKNRYNMALLMCGTVTSVTDFTDKNGGGSFNINKAISLNEISGTITSYYGYYWSSFKAAINKSSNSSNSGISQRITELEDKIQGLWSDLYNNYSQFIYEATYENSDELDSLSLYNQAIAYFEDYHHPKSSYSVEILNLDDLERIGAPNLKVNSRIRIYNEDLGLDEGESYTSGSPDEKLNNISYTNNELIITALDYELRKSAAVSITVEKIIQHQAILQKLIKGIK